MVSGKTNAAWRLLAQRRSSLTSLDVEAGSSWLVLEVVLPYIRCLDTNILTVLEEVRIRRNTNILGELNADQSLVS